MRTHPAVDSLAAICFELAAENTGSRARLLCNPAFRHWAAAGARAHGCAAPLLSGRNDAGISCAAWIWNGCSMRHVRNHRYCGNAGCCWRGSSGPCRCSIAPASYISETTRMTSTAWRRPLNATTTAPSNGIMPLWPGIPVHLAASTVGTAGMDMAAVYWRAGAGPGLATENFVQADIDCCPAIDGPCSPPGARTMRLKLAHQQRPLRSGSASARGHKSRHGRNVCARVKGDPRQMGALPHELGGASRGRFYAIVSRCHESDVRHAAEQKKSACNVHNRTGAASTLWRHTDIRNPKRLVEIEATAVKDLGAHA